MFTTGRKQSILNVNHKITVDAAKKLITVEGVGIFPISAVGLAAASYAESVAAVAGTSMAKFVAGNTVLANFAANELLTVGLTFGTLRRDSDYKENGISEDNTLIITVKPASSSYNDLAAAIRAELDALDYDAKAKYHIGTVAGATDEVLVTSDSEYYVLDYIEVNGVGGIKVSAFAPVNDGTGNSVLSVIGRGLPKQLEEVVKADSEGNTEHLLGIKNDMQINWNTTYAQLTLKNTSGPSAPGGMSQAINGVIGKVKEAILYIDMQHAFVTTWDTATTGAKDIIEAATGDTFITGPTNAEEATWAKEGGLLEYV